MGSPAVQPHLAGQQSPASGGVHQPAGFERLLPSIGPLHRDPVWLALAQAHSGNFSLDAADAPLLVEAAQLGIEAEPVDEKGGEGRVGRGFVHNVAGVPGAGGVQLVIVGETVLGQVLFNEGAAETEVLEEVGAQFHQGLAHDGQFLIGTAHHRHPQRGEVAPEVGRRKVPDDTTPHDQEIGHDAGRSGKGPGVAAENVFQVPCRTCRAFPARLPSGQSLLPPAF